MSQTAVLALVSGRPVARTDVPDPAFAGGMAGYGAAVDPPCGVIAAVAPVSAGDSFPRSGEIDAGAVLFTASA